MKKLTLLISLLILAGLLTAQESSNEGEKKQPNSWAISLNGGASQFYGDISSHTYYYPFVPIEEDLSYSIFASIEKHFNSFYGLRIRGGYTSYRSTDSPESTHSLPVSETGPVNTESTIFDIYLENKFSLSNLFWPKIYSKKVSFYALLGYGIPFYRTLLEEKDGTFIDSEGYSNNGETKENRQTAGSISTGLGFRYKFSQHLAASVEANIESLNTDRLDAADNALSELDKYGYTSIGVVYTFGSNDAQVPMEYHPIPEKDLAMQNKIDSLTNAVDDINDKVDTINNKVDQLAQRWEGPDSDNDGVSDSYDNEPDTEADALVNYKGETIKQCEKCPENMEELTKEPEVTTGDMANANVAFESVYFGLNSTYITPENMKKVAKAAKIMKNNPDVKFKIVGSACKISSDRYNKDLSKRRAQSVKDALVDNYNIKENRIKIDFTGEEDPMVDKPLYINRRADLFMLK